MDVNTAAILTEPLTPHGLSATNADEKTVRVANPLNLGTAETVGTHGGRHVTDGGYELGETGDEEGTARRLVHFLDLPRR